jgi:hypothetical protein
MGYQFTHKNLEQIVNAINVANHAEGLNMVLFVREWCGSSIVYSATPEQREKGEYNSELEQGLPIECYHAAMRWSEEQLRDVVDSRFYCEEYYKTEAV